MQNDEAGTAAERLRSGGCVEDLPRLFVYGTLRRASRNPSRRQLMDGASFLGHGSIRGLLLDLGAYPGAVADPAGRGRIRGELYEMARPRVALPALDIYEGCVPRPGEPQLFRRVLSEVELDEGARRTAWVYWYIGSLSGARMVPGGDYLEAGRRDSSE